MKSSVTSTLWHDIAAATADLGPEATALRIPLWVELREPPHSWRKRAGAIAAACSQFLTISRKTGKLSPHGRVLFCFPHRTPSNVHNLLPVAREALRRGLLGGILTMDDLSAELHEFAGRIPIVSAREIIGQLSFKDRVRNVFTVARTYKRITEVLARNLPGFRLTGRRAMLIRMQADSILYGLVCEQLLDVWLPKCVITTSDFWPLEHQLCRQASNRQITSLIVQHGTIDYIWWPFVADLYCMWGTAHVEQMRDIGAPLERMMVLGMPATDKLFERTDAASQRPPRNSSQSVCLLLSMTNGRSAEPEIFRNYRKFLDNVIRLIPSITWKVKLHPVEDQSFYREMGEDICTRLIFHPKQVTLEEAVNDADVVSTIYSTAGMEAMVMDRPLIVAPATDRIKELAWWPAMGGGTYTDTAEEFQMQWKKLTTDPGYRTRQLDEQRKFLSRSFANQGHAAERIVDLLEQYSDQAPHGHSPARVLSSENP